MNVKVLFRTITVTAMLLLVCAGCSKTTEKEVDKPSQNQFDAEVIGLYEGYIMVEALEGQTIAGEVQVWTGLLSEDEIPEMEEGTIVRITHDGKMTMSLPPQMSAVEISLYHP